ncbi:MAG: efflux RND transporter periplasmic adaptor subunit [Pseudomonadota bacterium]
MMYRCIAFIFLVNLLVTLPCLAETKGSADNTDKAVGDPAETVRLLLISPKETLLSSEISARIDTISVDVGDHFAKGHLLVSFNCSIYQAELAKSEALIEEAEKTLEVNRRLEKLGSISELEVAVAAARLSQVRADAAIKKYQVENCTIRAPFAGGVVKRVVAPHQYITPGQVVLQIIDTGNIEVQMHIPSLWIKNIKPSTPFVMHIDEVQKQYIGVVTALGVRIDSTSQTIEIRGRAKGVNPELLAGMSGSAWFDFK